MAPSATRDAWEALIAPIGRATRLPPRLLARLPEDGSLLDVGAGSGRMARTIAAARPDLSIVGVDTVIQPDAAIPVIPFDGRRLPFADGCFDTAMLIDVLHHDRDPAALLAEAARVTRGTVLVKDHYWRTRLDRWVLRRSDDMGNAGLNIALPHTYLRLSEWPALFAAAGLGIESRETFHYSLLDRCKQVIFTARKFPARKSG